MRGDDNGSGCATLCLKKAFLLRVWQESAEPLQVAEAHDTLLVQASMVSVQVIRSSKRVRSLVKQARQQWMEGQVTEIAVAAENGNLKPLHQFNETARLAPKVATPLFLPFVATTPQKIASVWRHHFAEDFDHRIRMVPLESLARPLQEIQTRIQSCDKVEDTQETPAFLIPCNGKTQFSCKRSFVTLWCRWKRVFLDWVNELSKVAGTMRAGKAIGVDSIPPGASRLSGEDCWCQLAGVAKQAVSCNQFPDVWKGGIMCGVPRKPGLP